MPVLDLLLDKAARRTPEDPLPRSLCSVLVGVPGRGPAFRWQAPSSAHPAWPGPRLGAGGGAVAGDRGLRARAHRVLGKPRRERRPGGPPSWESCSSGGCGRRSSGSTPDPAWGRRGRGPDGGRVRGALDPGGDRPEGGSGGPPIPSTPWTSPVPTRGAQANIIEHQLDLLQTPRTPGARPSAGRALERRSAGPCSCSCLPPAAFEAQSRSLGEPPPRGRGDGSAALGALGRWDQRGRGDPSLRFEPGCSATPKRRPDPGAFEAARGWWAKPTNLPGCPERATKPAVRELLGGRDGTSRSASTTRTPP